MPTLKKQVAGISLSVYLSLEHNERPFAGRIMQKFKAFKAVAGDL